MAKQRLQTFDESETSYAEGGKYLPLKVWAQQGFDTDLIQSQTLPEDIYNDDVLGVCYRLRIREKKQNYRSLFLVFWVTFLCIDTLNVIYHDDKRIENQS